MGKPIPIDRVRENIADREIAGDAKDRYTQHQAEREARGVRDRPGAAPNDEALEPEPRGDEADEERR